MDSGDPWSSDHPNNVDSPPVVVSRTSDSWADFAAFGNDSFASSFPGDSGVAAPPPNTCMATSPPIENSSQSPIITVSETASATLPVSIDNSVVEEVQQIDAPLAVASDPVNPATSSLETAVEGESTASHSNSNVDKTGLDSSAESTS